ncbi:hypothetical protein NMY22_g17759 [Coprinellus aureogranulatus]|nr:hypothetical protein NMY22_g17759 [Coprinellus aureogranulatus]
MPTPTKKETYAEVVRRSMSQQPEVEQPATMMPSDVLPVEVPTSRTKKERVRGGGAKQSKTVVKPKLVHNAGTADVRAGSESCGVRETARSVVRDESVEFPDAGELPLERDDSMYKGKAPVNRVRVDELLIKTRSAKVNDKRTVSTRGRSGVATARAGVDSEASALPTRAVASLVDQDVDEPKAPRKRRLSARSPSVLSSEDAESPTKRRLRRRSRSPPSASEEEISSSVRSATSRVSKPIRCDADRGHSGSSNAVSPMEVDGDPREADSGGEISAAGDGYATEDSFIDDSTLQDDSQSDGRPNSEGRFASTLPEQPITPTPSSRSRSRNGEANNVNVKARHASRTDSVTRDGGDEEPSPPRFGDSSSSAARSAKLSSGAHKLQKRRTFGSVVKSPGSASSDAKRRSTQNSTLHEDLTFHDVKVLPDVCEVTSPELQDPALAEYYIGLPPLKAGVFESWSDAEGNGMVSFSRWSDICPSMSFDSVLSAVEFRSYKNYVNPARVSPLDLCIRTIPGKNIRSHLYTREREPAMCLSTVLCRESHVLQPPPKGLRQKWLSGVFHSQEWERTVGAICTSFGHDVLQAQLMKDAMQFATRAYFGGREPHFHFSMCFVVWELTVSLFIGNPPPSSPEKSASMYSNIRSPSVSSKAKTTSASSDTFSLAHDADSESHFTAAGGLADANGRLVPVYDCREVEVDFARDLDKLHTYPMWVEEIPEDSFLVVAYTVAVYKASSKQWTVSFNIHWVMILGTPA